MSELVLVHGWGFGPGVWQPLLDALTSLGRHGRVRTVALPGYGTPGFDPAALPDGATVCGWSLGGMLALSWARQWPDKVARLVLVGTTPRFLAAPGWADAQPPELLEGFAASLAADPAATLRRFAALANQGDEQARPVTRQLTRLLEAGLPAPAALAAGLDQLRDTDLRAAVPAIAQPTLVIHGERDPLMPLAAGRWLAEHLPAARLAIIPGSAHAPFLSRPEEFAARLTEFLDA